MPATPFLNTINLFESGIDGYQRYRIPGLIVTSKGTVIVSCDARRDPNLGDWSDIDLFIRRSRDCGATWESPVKLVHRGLHKDQKIDPNPAAAEQGLGAGDQYPFNNQTLLIDRATGDILFIYCLNYGRCFVLRSSDEGTTWSAPQEIVQALQDLRRIYPWKVIGTGPNHGIQIRSGRMLVPVWLSRGGGDHGHRPSVVSTIFSDDGGRAWRGGDIIATEVDPLVNPSESIAVELADGSVMLNMRSESLQHRRGVAYSPDGATQWTRPEFVNDLAEPVCMAGIERLSSVESHGRSRLVFSHCDNCTEPRLGHVSRFYLRKKLTVRLSYDEGRTWPVARVLEPSLSGYSDIHPAPDGTLFCFYERGSTDGSGEANNNRYLTLAHFNLEWLSEQSDSLASRP